MMYWLGVVARAHVERGVAGGFAQLCHGKEGPLRRMQPGDWLIYYSPTVEMGGERLQTFTALGEVVDERVYPHDMGGGFVPFRRAVRYLPVRPAPLAVLAPALHLTARPNWGMALRRGHLPLDEHDFHLIAAALLEDGAALHRAPSSPTLERHRQRRRPRGSTSSANPHLDRTLLHRS
jgi:hypothetical protein